MVIAESISHHKIARLFHDAGPALGRQAMECLLESLAQAAKLAIDDIGIAAGQFFSLILGDHSLTMLMNLRPPLTDREQQAQVDRAVEQFLRIYGTDGELR